MEVILGIPNLHANLDLLTVSLKSEILNQNFNFQVDVWLDMAGWPLSERYLWVYSYLNVDIWVNGKFLCHSDFGDLVQQWCAQLCFATSLSCPPSDTCMWCTENALYSPLCIFPVHTFRSSVFPHTASWLEFAVNDISIFWCHWTLHCRDISS